MRAAESLQGEERAFTEDKETRPQVCARHVGSSPGHTGLTCLLPGILTGNCPLFPEARPVPVSLCGTFGMNVTVAIHECGLKRSSHMTTLICYH